MILFSLDEFRDWLMTQPEWPFDVYVPPDKLHTICVRFKEECDDQQTALEHSMAYRVAQDKERAAAHAARESAARKCAADAVRAEVDYDAEMTLPEKKTCADCIHVDRCVDVLGCTNPESTRCDFYPNRFSHSYQED